MTYALHSEQAGRPIATRCDWNSLHEPVTAIGSSCRLLTGTTTVIAGFACVLLLAGCGPEGGAANEGQSSTTQTTIVATTTTTTTSKSAVTTLAASTASSTVDGFPTIEELIILTRAFPAFVDAQVTSFVAVYGDEEELEALGREGGVVESMTITYFGDLTVWDLPGGFREVRSDSGLLYLSEDGTWLESDRFEWPPFGPLAEWEFAQSAASQLFESDPEVVGFEQVVGVPTLHLREVVDEASVDLWVDASGLVMKLITEAIKEDPSLRLQIVWEVTGLDVKPEGPLPPG